MSDFYKYLNERVYRQSEGFDTKIFVNPTPSEAKTFRRSRGFVDNAGVVWLWTYDYADHREMAALLKETIAVAFYIHRFADWSIVMSDFSSTVPKNKRLEILNNNRVIRSWGIEFDPEGFDLGSEKPVVQKQQAVPVLNGLPD